MRQAEGEIPREENTKRGTATAPPNQRLHEANGLQKERTLIAAAGT
jgi:hypothetical protein